MLTKNGRRKIPRKGNNLCFPLRPERALGVKPGTTLRENEGRFIQDKAEISSGILFLGKWKDKKNLKSSSKEGDMKRLDIYDYHLDPCVQSRFEEIWTGCWGFPCGSSGKEPVCQCRRLKKRGFEPWVRKIPWRRAWKSTPVFLPEESHGQRSLAG